MKLTPKELQDIGGGQHQLKVRLTKLYDPKPVIEFEAGCWVAEDYMLEVFSLDHNIQSPQI